jgi:hypothetical protein
MGQEVRPAGGINKTDVTNRGPFLKKMSIRLVLRSDSHNVYPGNTPYDFKVHLPKPLYFQGHRTVSLSEFSLLSGNTGGELYVRSNLCQDSIVGERELHLLQPVILEKVGNIIYSNPYEVPLRMGEFQDVRVYIRDSSDQAASFLNGVVTVTLL